MDGFIMALDQRTTGSRCLLVRPSGEALHSTEHPLSQINPMPGWSEHDPMEILRTQLAAAGEVMRENGVEPKQIRGIGVSNQRETLLLWERDSGKPVHNAILWRCRRSEDICERLRADGLGRMILEKTGLPIDPYFSGTKLKWVLDSRPELRARARDGKLLFGTVDSWLLWHLTRGRAHVTDRTNASRTMLFNIDTLDWDDDILRILDIPRSMLPEVKPSCGVFGMLDKDFMGVETPIAGVAGDQQAALFGQLCHSAGHAKNTYGTGCFLLMHTGKRPVRSAHGLVTTIAASVEGVEYALEGSIFSGHAALEWLRDELGVVATEEEGERLACELIDNGGVYFVPAFTGLGAPYWKRSARGMFTGLNRSAGRAHFARAALESMAFQTMDVLSAMERDAGLSLAFLKVDGDPSASSFLMQFQADILDREVIRPRELSTSALGVAFLAGIATGFWGGIEEIRDNAGGDAVFSPGMPESQRRGLISGWKRAVDSTLYWARREAGVAGMRQEHE